MRLSLLCLCDADVLLMYAGYIFVTRDELGSYKCAIIFAGYIFVTRKRDGLLPIPSLFPITMLAGYIFVTRDRGNHCCVDGSL